MTEQKTSRTPWVYDDEPLEEPNGAPAEEHADKKTTYKTSPNMLKAIRKYEEEVKKTQINWNVVIIKKIIPVLSLSLLMVPRLTSFTL